MNPEQYQKSQSLNWNLLEHAFERPMWGDQSWFLGNFENFGDKDEVICTSATYNEEEDVTTLEFRYTS